MPDMTVKTISSSSGACRRGFHTLRLPSETHKKFSVLSFSVTELESIAMKVLLKTSFRYLRNFEITTKKHKHSSKKG
jgi:hypothetical protein